MKKLLSLLGALTMVASTSATVISCGDPIKPTTNEKIQELIQEYKEEVNEIVREQIRETNKNFLLIDNKNSNMSFFNKRSFQKYMGYEELKKADKYARQDISEDFNQLFNVKELETKINALKREEKYSVILGDVDKVFNEVTLTESENIELKSKTRKTVNNKEIWFGTANFDYSVSTSFKNEKNIVEEYKIEDIHSVISITDDEEVGGNIQEMYTSIEVDFLKSELSKVYPEMLSFKNGKTYLQEDNIEVSEYFNKPAYTNKFIKFVKDTYNIDINILGENTFNSITNIVSYRENVFTSNSIFESFFLNDANNNSTSYLVDKTESESEKYMTDKVKASLSKIGSDVPEKEEIKPFIEASIKFKEMRVKNMTYKFSDNDYVEIPDLNLNFGYFKNSEIISRKDKAMKDDIIANIELARSTLNSFFGITTPKTWNEGSEGVARFKPALFTFATNKTNRPTPLMQKIIKLDDLYGQTVYDIDHITNLTHYSLLDNRNELISKSKQNKYLFNVRWNQHIGGDLPKLDYYESYAGPAYGLNFQKDLTWKINVNFEFDYFKFRTERSGNTWYEKVALFRANARSVIID